MIFVDANVWLDATDAEPALSDPAVDALDAARREYGLATSYLVLDEFVWVASKRTSREAAVATAQGILDTPGLSLLPIDKRVAAQALELMLRPGLDPHDAAHAATALGHGCKHILSTDPDFDQVKGLTRIPL